MVPHSRAVGRLSQTAHRGRSEILECLEQDTEQMKQVGLPRERRSHLRGGIEMPAERQQTDSWDRQDRHHLHLRHNKLEPDWLHRLALIVVRFQLCR